MKNTLYVCLVVALVGGCQSETWLSNPSAQDIPRLVRLLREGDESSRAQAALALGLLGADGKPALPELLSSLGDEGETVRQNALCAIIAIGPDPTATQALTNSLHDSDNGVRALSANALGQLGPLARQSIPALREAMRDRDEDVRKEAADALMRIDPRSSIR